MIAEAEIRRYAARWGVDPMVVDLLLAIQAMFEQDWQRRLGYLTPDADAAIRKKHLTQTIE